MFYQIYLKLCNEKGISPTKAGEEMGINRGTISKWKNKGTSPTFDKLTTIAEYFNVPLSVFDDKKSSDDELKFALFGDTENITDEMFDDVKRYAEFVKEKYKNDNN